MINLIASKLRLVTIALNALGTLLILILVAMINLDVLSMNTLGAPITGVKESIALSIAVIVFLQLPETLRSNRHISSDMWITVLITRRPRTGATVQAVFHLIGAGVVLLIARYGWPMMTEAYSNSYFVGTRGYFTLPTWPTFAIVVACAFITALQYLVIALQYLSRALSSSRTQTPTEG